eukprot:GAHX01000349.1.p1 GENE.GAHX01000349.1~~GAHX01000349.1.p1  ORF type:complete len:854 (+),score=197.75 GAHX01000349.1:50-2563(+)
MDEPQVLDKDILESPIKKTKLIESDNTNTILNQDPRISSFFTDITTKEFNKVFKSLKESVSWKEDLLSLLGLPASDDEFNHIFSHVFCTFWKELAVFLYKNEIVTSPLDLIISDIMNDFQTSTNRTIRLAAYNFLFSFLECSPSSDLYEKLYSKAFRDVFHSVRLLSIETLNLFLKDEELQEFILHDQKLKYAGWLLNDKEYKVRELTLTFIEKMLLCEDTSAFGKSDKAKFYKKFGPRIEDMLHDKNHNVVIKAIDLLEKTQKDGDYDTLILEDNVKIRTKMVDVYTKGKKINITELEQILKDTLKANYPEEDKTSLIARAISMFITKKRLVLDYSLIKKFNDFEFYLTISLLSLVNKHSECTDNTAQIMSIFYKLFKKLCTTKNYNRLKIALKKIATDKVNIVLKQQESTFVYNKIAGLLKDTNEREYLKFLVGQLINNEYNRDSLMAILRKTIIAPSSETAVKEFRNENNVALIKEFLIVTSERIPGIQFFTTKQPHTEWVKYFILDNTLLNNFILGDISCNTAEVILLQLTWKLNIILPLNGKFSTDILMQPNREEAINNIEDEDERGQLHFLLEVINSMDLESSGKVLNSLVDSAKYKKQRQTFLESKVLQYTQNMVLMLGGLEAKKQSGRSSMLHTQHGEKLSEFYKDVLLFVKNIREKIPKEESESFAYIIKTCVSLDFVSQINERSLGSLKQTLILKMLCENIKAVDEGFTKTHVQLFREIKQVQNEDYIIGLYMELCYQLIKNGNIEDLDLLKIQDIRRLFFGYKGKGIEKGVMKAIEHIKTDINIDMGIQAEVQERIVGLVDLFVSTFNIKYPKLSLEIKTLLEQNN